MKLLPSQQTEAQQRALLRFFRDGKITLREPCDCGGQVRHNNGGNYHTIVEFRMEAGLCLRNETCTGDYAPADDWLGVKFSVAVDEIASLAAAGW